MDKPPNKLTRLLTSLEAPFLKHCAEMDKHSPNSQTYTAIIKGLSTHEKLFAKAVLLAGYHFIVEKEFEGLVGNGGKPLRYDFFIPKLNLLIEVDGIHHSIPYAYKNQSVERAIEIHRDVISHDHIKNSYVGSTEGLRLYRVPFGYSEINITPQFIVNNLIQYYTEGKFNSPFIPQEYWEDYLGE
jgi:very-short-patch-repair endonuclease